MPLRELPENPLERSLGDAYHAGFSDAQEGLPENNPYADPQNFDNETPVDRTEWEQLRNSYDEGFLKGKR